MRPMAKWIIAAILLLPLAEIAAFILVAALVGLGVAFLLMLATTLAGFLVLRRAGRGGIARFRVTMADTDVAGIQRRPCDVCGPRARLQSSHLHARGGGGSCAG